MTIEVRAATAADFDQIVALQKQLNHVEDPRPLQGFVDDPEVGIGSFTVAVDGARLVSSMVLLREELAIGGVTVPAAEVGYVATDAEYQNQGLVRRQFDLAHEWSDGRGDLVQLIAGIAYFYRLFGYEYAIEMPAVRLVLPGREPAMPSGWTVRPAAPDDVDAVLALQQTARHAADVTSTHASPRWKKAVLENRGATVVAEREGNVHGVASIGGGPPGVGDGVSMLRGLAGDRRSAVMALVAASKEGGKPVAIQRRPGTLGDEVLAPMCVEHSRSYAWYVRTPDPVALIDRLRPVLDDRLASSPFADTSTRLLISLYRSSIMLSIDAGRVVGVESGGPEQDPTDRGGAGVAPDLVATLLLGRYGARWLEARYDDVQLGATAPLMDVLFPAAVVDLG